jgi:hypothetical protein
MLESTDGRNELRPYIQNPFCVICASFVAIYFLNSCSGHPFNQQQRLIPPTSNNDGHAISESFEEQIILATKKHK